jgi:hypothetical protein
MSPATAAQRQAVYRDGVRAAGCLYLSLIPDPQAWLEECLGKLKAL